MGSSPSFCRFHRGKLRIAASRHALDRQADAIGRTACGQCPIASKPFNANS
jgi:hypothetical protein